MSEKFLNKYRIQSARLQTWDYGNEGAYYITICTNGRKHYFGEISGGAMILNGTGKLAERFWNEIPNHFPFIELDSFVIMPNHVHGILIINREVAYRYDNITGNDTGGVNGDGNTMGNGNIMGDGNDAGGVNGDGNTMGNGNDAGGVNGDGNTMGNGNIMGDGNTMGNGNDAGGVNGNGNKMGNGNTMGNVETRLIASLQSPGIPQSQPQSQPEKPGGFSGNKNPMFHRNISRIIRWYKGRCSFEINKIHPVFAWQPRFYEHIIRDAAEWERIRNYITDNPANWKEGKSNEK